MIRIACLLLLLLLAPNCNAQCPVVDESGCAICGQGQCVGNPDAVVNSSTIFPTTCGVLEATAVAGELPEGVCETLLEVVSDNCECGGNGNGGNATDANNNATEAPIDCTQFQQSITLEQDSLTMDYVVFQDSSSNDGETTYLKARLTFQGQAWLSLGIAPPGSVSMVPGNAVIGKPDTNEVGKYNMFSTSLFGVQLFDEEMQTLVDAEIFQNDTVTILNFTKRLVEPDELPIVSDGGMNTFLWAYGFDNNFFSHRGRGAFDLTLQTCTGTGGVLDNDGFQTVDVGGTQQALWTAHGWFAALAWGLFSPIAIGASLLRSRLPAGPLWFKIHFYLHLMVVGMTLVSFSLAVAAHQQGTPAGKDPKHFTGLVHRSLGLAITILALIQVVAGYFRAPNPKKNDDGSFEPKTQLRVLWEVGHKGLGVALLAMCWYQCSEGVRLYETNFGTTVNYTAIFWGVAGSVAGVIVVLFVWQKVVSEEKNDVPAKTGDQTDEKNIDNESSEQEKA